MVQVTEKKISHRKILYLLLILIIFFFHPVKKSNGQGTFMIDDSDITEFSAKIGQNDDQYYYLSGYGFTAFQIVYLEVSDPSGAFTISTDNGSTYATTGEVQADEFGDIDAQIG